MSTARTLAESTRPRVFNSEEETPSRLEGKVGENKWINSTTQNVCYAQRKTFRKVRNAGWRRGGGGLQPVSRAEGHVSDTKAVPPDQEECQAPYGGNGQKEPFP